MDLDNIKVDRDVRIVFMGTPDFAVPVLEALIKNYNVRAIITQPDKKIGREGKVIYSAVKQVGIDNTILVLQPESLKISYEDILALEPDLIITCAYGQILPEIILNAPRLGCINVHASLLPKLRGGAPINYAIINGYSKTGITIMYMNNKMDEGDIITQREIDILPTDNATSLHDKLKYLGRDLLLDTLPNIIDGTNRRLKQDNSEATYAFTLKRSDERLDFSKTRREVNNKVRGLSEKPGAYCLLNGKILKIYESYVTDNIFPELLNGQITKLYHDGFGVKVQNGEVVFKIVQLEGKKKMLAVDFINGINDKNKFLNTVLE